jgi:hypothetical protein
MLTLMNANRPLTLKEIITEAQQVEEILYLRNKEARRRTNQHSKTIASTSLLALITQNQYSSRNTEPPSTTPFTPTCWRCWFHEWCSRDTCSPMTVAPATLAPWLFALQQYDIELPSVTRTMSEFIELGYRTQQ